VHVPQDELVRALGSAGAARAGTRFRAAAKAFDHGDPAEARRLLRPVATSAPDAPTVRELLGLTLYRLGRWSAAAAELEAYRRLTGSTLQHPVLADCYRALRRWQKVDELWDELRAASPSAALVTEGRIVAAGALADRDRLRDAIELLERGRRRPVKRPQEHHLRLAYVLADLYERAGDVPRSRQLFAWVVSVDGGFVDAAERLRALR
jgi:predicted Zn-dependent protease